MISSIRHVTVSTLKWGVGLAAPALITKFALNQFRSMKQLASVKPYSFVSVTVGIPTALLLRNIVGCSWKTSLAFSFLQSMMMLSTLDRNRPANRKKIPPKEQQIEEFRGRPVLNDGASNPTILKIFPYRRFRDMSDEEQGRRWDEFTGFFLRRLSENRLLPFRGYKQEVLLLSPNGLEGRLDNQTVWTISFTDNNERVMIYKDFLLAKIFRRINIEIPQMKQQQALTEYAVRLNREDVQAFFTNYIELSFPNERKGEPISLEEEPEKLIKTSLYLKKNMDHYVPSLIMVSQKLIQKYRSKFFDVDLFNNLIKPHDEYLKIKYEKSRLENPEAHIFTFETYKGRSKPFRQIVCKFDGNNPAMIYFHIIKNKETKKFNWDVKNLGLHSEQYPNVERLELQDGENLFKEVALIHEGIKEVIDYLTCEHTLVFNSVSLLCGDVTGKQIASERIKQIINLTNDAEGNSLLSTPKQRFCDFSWCGRDALG